MSFTSLTFTMIMTENVIVKVGRLWALDHKDCMQRFQILATSMCWRAGGMLTSSIDCLSPLWSINSARQNNARICTLDNKPWILKAVRYFCSPMACDDEGMDTHKRGWCIKLGRNALAWRRYQPAKPTFNLIYLYRVREEEAHEDWADIQTSRRYIPLPCCCDRVREMGRNTSRFLSNVWTGRVAW